MPEWGQLPIPKKLLAKGVRDMVRVSDARMSGTSYGACVLHVAPESFIGGPLALVRDGDIIDSTSRPAPQHAGERRRARRGAAPPGGSPRHAMRAATGGCSRTMSARRTKAATSIFSSAQRRRRTRKSISWATNARTARGSRLSANPPGMTGSEAAGGGFR